MWAWETKLTFASASLESRATLYSPNEIANPVALLTSSLIFHVRNYKTVHEMVEKVMILGSGPAGLSAAIYAAREGFEPVVIRGHNPGGQLILTTLVENIPGFPQGVIGADYIKLLNDQAKKFGTRFVDDDVTKVDLTKRPFKIFVENKEYETSSVIIATGANPRWLGIESEKRFIGRGVSNCATCDGNFFKGKDVIVVGGATRRWRTRSSSQCL